MNKDVVKRGLSDYQFLKLFVSISAINGYATSINNKTLENDMYNYVNDSRYRFLFNDIDIDVEKKKINLSQAYDYCYTFGILKKSHDIHDYGMNSLINVTYTNSNEIISKYNDYEIAAMNELCDDYYQHIRESNKIMVKK